MNRQEKLDAQILNEIDAVMATISGSACICNRARLPLDKILLREFSTEELMAVTAIAGLERNYDPDFWINEGVEGKQNERVYGFTVCRAHVQDLAVAMKAVIAIRQHVEVWIW